MRVARRAGTRQASPATPATANAVTAKVSGSAAETSKSRLVAVVDRQKLAVPRLVLEERASRGIPFENHVVAPPLLKEVSHLQAAWAGAEDDVPVRPWWSPVAYSRVHSNEPLRGWERQSTISTSPVTSRPSRSSEPEPLPSPAQPSLSRT